QAAGEPPPATQRRPAVTGSNASQLDYCERRHDERCETDHGCSCDREIRVTAAEGVAHRRDADREGGSVLDRVEEAVERDEEAEVEELEEDDRAEHEPSDPRHDAPGAGRQGNGQADDDESL